MDIENSIYEILFFIRLGWWNDNYLCVANDSVYKFHWSENGPIAGLGCLGWPTRNERVSRKPFLCAKFFDGRK